MTMFGCCYIFKRYVRLVIVSIVIAFYGFMVFFPVETQITYAQTAPGNPPCSAINLQHWDKIVFEIVSPLVASQAGLPANTELDIKVIDDPSKVVDVKQTVLSLIKVPQAQRDSIEIVDVEYSVVCTQGGPAGAPGASASASAVAVAVATIITNQTNQTTPTPPPVDNVTLPGPPPSPIEPGTNDTLPGPGVTFTCPDGTVVASEADCPPVPELTFTCPDGTVVASEADCPPVPEPEPEPEPNGGENQDGSDNEGGSEE
jgi:hypothetical protein